jgi:hypothetical protein
MYDYLRTYHPRVGEQCAKIRAEFTMHNGLAVALLLIATVYTVRQCIDDEPDVVWRSWICAALVAGSIVESWRGWTTNETFNSTVVKFFTVRKSRPTTFGAESPEPPPTG